MRFFAQHAIASLALAVLSVRIADSFVIPRVDLSSDIFIGAIAKNPSRTQLASSISADGSEYAADVEVEEMEDTIDWSNADEESGEDDVPPTIELQPVPLSKNAGNRFVAVVWDREFYPADKDVSEMHEERVALSEDHVMYCRKQNLYNETFNAESMVDIVWSLQMYVFFGVIRYAVKVHSHPTLSRLSSDLRRVIGHAMCLESTHIDHVHECLARDPIVQKLSKTGDTSQIPLYRWRHLKDSTLRIDDGREGCPCICIGLDYSSEELPDATGIRQQVWNSTLEYLIRSERIIATGPLHVPTTFKNDPSSYPLGDWILFNAKDREDAIAFAESLPGAEAGLYKSLRVHFYNMMDVTGKFVSENPLYENQCADMKEAMEYWGYPVDDEQTPWLNW